MFLKPHGANIVAIGGWDVDMLLKDTTYPLRDVSRIAAIGLLTLQLFEVFSFGHYSFSAKDS